MTLDLNDFIKKAVSDVRNSRAVGKKGRQARKNIASGAEALKKAQDNIKAIAEACSKREWISTRLVMLKVSAECKCCHTTVPACPEAIYLEKKHKTKGTTLTRQDAIGVDAFPNLPRELYERVEEHYICEKCFISYNHKQLELPFEEDKPFKFDARPSEEKRKEAHARASEIWNRNARMQALRNRLPQTLLLTHTA